MINFKNDPKTNKSSINTSSTAFLMGATGQEGISSGPESNYLLGKAPCLTNRPRIIINQGGRYRIEGKLSKVKDLCQIRCDQKFERGNFNYESLQIVVEIAEVAKKFSDHFGEFAGGGVFIQVPLVAEGMTFLAGKAENKEIILTFYLSYGSTAGKKLSAWELVTKGDKGNAQRNPVFALGNNATLGAVGKCLLAI